MADSENIDDIVSSGAIKSIYDAEKALKALYDQLQKDITAAHALNQSLGGSNSLKDFNSTLNDAKLAQEKVAKAVAATQLQEERLAAFRANEATKEEARLKKLASNSGYNPYKNLSKDYDEAALKAQNLGAQLLVLKKRLGEKPSVLQQITISALSKEYEKATGAAKKLQTQLLDIDSKIGKYGRNVGNYKSGWNGLSNSINQISRELPAFTYSIQTGFMALSNNLPILFDEIRATKTEIAALRAEGKQVPGLFKQIMSSVFSWGTALSIGITLLTVFGKEIGEFIKAIFKGTKAIDYFVLAQKELQEVRRNGFKDAQTELVNLQNLYRNTTTANLSLSERKKLAKELQEQYPETFKNFKQEEILAGKAGKAYQFLTQQILATSLASALSSQIANNRIRDFDNEEKRIKARIDYEKEEVEIIKLRALALRATGSAGTGSSNSQGYYASIAAAEERRAEAGKVIREANIDSEELNKRNLKYIQQIDEATKKYGVTVLGVKEDESKSNKNTDFLDLEINRAERRAEALKRIADDETQDLEKRLIATRQYGEERVNIAELTAKKELSAEEITKDKITDINEQKKADIITANRETSDMVLKIQDDANKKLAGYLKDGLKNADEAEKAKIQVLLDGQNSRLEAIEKERSDATKVAQEMFDSGKMKRKQFDEEIFAIEKQASIDRIKLEIDTIQSIIDIQKQDLEFGIGTQKELSDNEKKLSDYRIALSKAESATKNAIKDSDLEKEKIRAKSLKDLSKEVYDFGAELVSSMFDRRVSALDKESEKLTEKKDLEIENVNASVLSEEDKADRIAVIEAQAEQQQKIIDAKTAETKRKQAIAEKAAAISQIIINFAVGYSKNIGLLGFLGLPLNAILAAQAALQIATVVAQPIPEYKHGKSASDNYEGLAYVGDGYKHELVVEKDGRSWVTPNKPTLTYVGRDTEVISGDRLERMRLMAKPDALSPSGTYIDVNGIIQSQKESAKQITNAVNKLVGKQKRQQSRMNMDEWKTYLKRNGL